VAPDLHIGGAEECGMRSMLVRWCVAVVVGSLWGAVVPPARPRAGRAFAAPRGAAQRIMIDPSRR